MTSATPIEIERQGGCAGRDPSSRAGTVLLALGRQLSRQALAFTILVTAELTAAEASPLRIVTIGASNTHGWYVGKKYAYPAQLQAMLKTKGIEAQVVNAGVPFDTSAAMLRRIDNDVADGTDIVILQPGSNDKRFFQPMDQRARNIAEAERKLQARRIKVIVYDEDIPWRYYTFDFIHLTHEGHTMIAEWLLPRVIAAMQSRPLKRSSQRTNREMRP